MSPIHIIEDLNVRLPSEQMLHKHWYKKGGYNRHSNILYHVINDNGLNVTDISSKQDVNYTYFCDATATYTWIRMARMAVFNVAGYPIEERRRWPVITASPRGQCSK